MADLFSKQIENIDIDDIRELRDTPEGLVFEIKSHLAAQGNKMDPWMVDPGDKKTRRGPEDRAKRDLFKELVAFANTEGGWLVLGVNETTESPKRAAEITAIPDCHELAERLQRASYDWIDPPLPGLKLRGVTLDPVNNAGVVVARVPRSSNAPHRLYKANLTQEAYKRVNDESKPMMMGEIQDKMYSSVRVSERAEKRLAQCVSYHNSLSLTRTKKIDSYGFYVAMTPTVTPVEVDRPYIYEDLFQREKSINGIEPSTAHEIKLETIDETWAGLTDSRLTPTLRGASKEWVFTFGTAQDADHFDEEKIAIHVWSDGSAILSVKSTYAHHDVFWLSIRWILAEVGNGFRILETIRDIGNANNVEFAIKIGVLWELKSQGEGQDVGIKIGELRDKDGRGGHILPKSPLELPLYSNSSKEEYPELLIQMTNDIYNAIGLKHVEDFEILPFI